MNKDNTTESVVCDGSENVNYSTIFTQLFILIFLQKNIGQKILKKQGWKEGQGLGKHLQGNIVILVTVHWSATKTKTITGQYVQI